CFALAEIDVHDGVATWPMRLSAVLYAALPLSLLLLMRTWDGSVVKMAIPELPAISLAPGVSWIYLAISLTWATDTAAYAIGRLIGRRPLSPRISPKKTWEGTIGGVLAGALVGGFWSQPMHWNVISGVAIGFLVACAAVFGDLVESALKRRVDVKDSGAFL